METMTAILVHFANLFYEGTARLIPYAMGLLSILISLDLLLTFLLNLQNQDHIHVLVKKSITYGMYALFIKAWGSSFAGLEPLVITVIKGFVKVGLLAGGNKITENVLTNPSAILDKGLNVVWPLIDALTSVSGVALALGATVPLLLTAFLIFIAFFVLALQVFLAYIEFYIIATVAVILLPFGALNRTAFLAEKAIGAVIGSGIKLMVISLVMCAVWPMIQNWNLPPNAGLDDCLKLLASVLTVTFLAWQCPSLAQGFMSGSPTLSGGAVASTAAGVVAAGGMAVNATKKGIETYQAIKTGGTSTVAKAAGSVVSKAAGGSGGETSSSGNAPGINPNTNSSALNQRLTGNTNNNNTP